MGKKSILVIGTTDTKGEELLFLKQQIQRRNFDVIIIDSPAASYKADVMSIGSVAGNALLVARSGYSRMDDTKSLISILRQARTNVVGAVLNQY